MGSRWQRRLRKGGRGMYIATAALACCLKAFRSITHQPRLALFISFYFVFFIPRHRLLIDWPAGVRWRREMQPKRLWLWVRREKRGGVAQGWGRAPVASGPTAIYGRWQFANISICGEPLGVTMRSAMKLEESAASIYFIRLSPMRCNCLTAWGYRGECAVTPADTLCINMFFGDVSQKDKKRGRLESWKASGIRWGKKQRNAEILHGVFKKQL